MGGNALKIVKTRRYSKEEYQHISYGFTRMLPFEIYIPKSYGAKDSFGDLDILVHSGSYNKIIGDKQMNEYIKETFNPREMYVNSNVVSFDYHEFQIDFIMVKTKYWETSKGYYEFNDLGNLIGRIAYQMGFRYGHFGLKLVYRHADGGRKFEKIITQDLFDILQFLGFDPDEYHIGFYELRDIFAFVIKSKYFNPSVFQYEALNHQNKTRNKKRANYAGFLKYIEGEKFENLHEYQNKDYYVKKADEYFGIDIGSEIEVWNKVVERDKEVSTKFNGYLIMERYPQLKGKELGNAIGRFKKELTKEYSVFRSDYKNAKDMFDRWILNNDIDFILKRFKEVNNL